MTCDTGSERLSLQGSQRPGRRTKDNEHPASDSRGALAYYAAFHAAEALIVERSGKIAKTHTGVRTAFARCLKEASDHDRALLRFLVQAYKYKQVSDYGIGRVAVIADAEAWDAITSAEDFIARVADWIGE